MGILEDNNTKRRFIKKYGEKSFIIVRAMKYKTNLSLSVIADATKLRRSVLEYWLYRVK